MKTTLNTKRNYVKTGLVAKAKELILEKYGSWYYLLSDGVLVQKPMSEGDTLKDAPLYDSNDDELVVVCSTAFNDEERKEFDNDMKQLFGDSYNGLSAQSVG